MTWINIENSIDETLPPEVRLVIRGFLQERTPFLSLANDAPINMRDIQSFRNFCNTVFIQLAKLSGKTPEILPSSEFRRRSHSFSERIFSSRTSLLDMLDNHYHSLCKRWRKINQKEKYRIIKKCWPGIPMKHRPDFQMFYSDWDLSQPEGVSPYMHPEINLEDLSDGGNLCLLLESRGRNDPIKFVYADFDASKLGRSTGKLIVPTLENAGSQVMVLDGSDKEMYGRLEAGSNTMKLLDLYRFEPEVGLLILQIQAEKLEFCCRCFHEILPKMKELPVDPLSGAQEQFSNLFPPRDDWSFRAIQAAQSAYRVPECTNLQHLLEVVALKKRFAEEHIMSLREDPGYFADFIRQWDQHQPQRIPRAKSTFPSIDLNSDEYRNKMVKEAITQAYTNFEIWSFLHNILSELIEASPKQPEDLAYPELPNEKLLVAQANVWVSLYTLCSVFNIYLQEFVPASATFRDLFIRRPGERKPNRKFEEDSIVTKSTQTNPLLFLLRETVQFRLVSLSSQCSFIDELERLIQSSTEAKKLSGLILEMLDNLSLLRQIMKEIEKLSPWKSISNYCSENSSIIDKHILEVCLAIRGKSRPMFQGFSEAGKWVLVLDKFRCPYSRNTSESVQKAINSESLLDDFWHAADKAAQDFLGDSSIEEEFHSRFSISLEVKRTAKWTEATDLTQNEAPSSKRKRKEHERASSSAKDEAFIPPTQEPFKGEKMKTRGVPQVETPVPAVREPSPKPVKTIKVNSESFEVFSYLFYDPNSVGKPGEIPWRRFLNAMLQAGFGHEYLNGSIWRFMPLKGANPSISKIEIHAPHGAQHGGKISRRKAMYLGRSLNAVFGWTLATFQEA